jgi:hypothetical protein
MSTLFSYNLVFVIHFYSFNSRQVRLRIVKSQPEWLKLNSLVKVHDKGLSYCISICSTGELISLIGCLLLIKVINSNFLLWSVLTDEYLVSKCDLHTNSRSILLYKTLLHQVIFVFCHLRVAKPFHKESIFLLLIWFANDNNFLILLWQIFPFINLRKLFISVLLKHLHENTLTRLIRVKGFGIAVKLV